MAGEKGNHERSRRFFGISRRSLLLAAAIILTAVLVANWAWIKLGSPVRPEVLVVKPSIVVGRLLISGVTIVNTQDGALTPNMSILLEKGEIASIAPSGSIQADGSTLSIDASGKFVVPGYLDMHAHLFRVKDPSKALMLMLANGVTGFRQMDGSPELLKERRDGTLPIGNKSPAVLAMPSWPLTPFNATSPDNVVTMVREQRAQGADFIKMAAVTPPIFFAALAEAKRINIPLLGHVPEGVNVRDASKGGMRAIEHLGPGEGIIAVCSIDEDAIQAEIARSPRFKTLPFKIPFIETILAATIHKIIINPVAGVTPENIAILERTIQTFSEDKCRKLAVQFVEDGTWQIPTLIRSRTTELADAPEYSSDPNLRYMSANTLKEWQASLQRFNENISPSSKEILRKAYALRLRLVNLFGSAGVKMLAGSDVSGIWEVPGFSLHQEFDQLEAAGLSPLRVLQMTTLNGAEFLGQTATMGSVKVRGIADLVLLDANPIDSVQNLHRIYGVVRAGRFYSKEDIEALKAAVRSGEGAVL